MNVQIGLTGLVELKVIEHLVLAVFGVCLGINLLAATRKSKTELNQYFVAQARSENYTVK